MLMTIEQVSARLGVCAKTVAKLCAQGNGFPLPMKLGSRRFWRAEELDRYIRGENRAIFPNGETRGVEVR
jgi:predicted DNA-binding transcriptional regulator AlpA